MKLGAPGTSLAEAVLVALGDWAPPEELRLPLFRPNASASAVVTHTGALGDSFLHIAG